MLKEEFKRAFSGWRFWLTCAITFVAAILGILEYGLGVFLATLLSTLLCTMHLIALSTGLVIGFFPSLQQSLQCFRLQILSFRTALLAMFPLSFKSTFKNISNQSFLQI